MIANGGGMRQVKGPRRSVTTVWWYLRTPLARGTALCRHLWRPYDTRYDRVSGTPGEERQLKGGRPDDGAARNKATRALAFSWSPAEHRVQLPPLPYSPIPGIRPRLYPI
jgi:hypothetical protein